MKGMELWRKFQLLLIIACGTCPAVLLLLDSLAPGLVAWGWLFSVVYLVLAFVGIQIKGKVRMTAGIGLSVLFVAGAFMLVSSEVRLGALAASVVCSGLLIWSLEIGGWPKNQEIPVFWVVAGMVCHFLGQVSLHVDRISQSPQLSRHAGIFLVALFGFCLLTMLSMNRKSLTDASGKRQSVPDSMRRRNMVMTVVLFLAALLTALLPSAFAGLGELMVKAVTWLVEVITKLIPDAPNESEFQKDTPQMIQGIGTMGEDGGLRLNPLVEKIAAFVGALLTIALTAFVLYRIAVILKDKIRELVTSIGKFAANVSEDYVDEVTDTREDGVAEKLQRRRRMPRLTVREERSLPPAERIRYRYRRILGKHPEWVPGTTAREALPAELARLYERVRYSEEAVTEADAHAFTGGTERI